MNRKPNYETLYAIQKVLDEEQMTYVEFMRLANLTNVTNLARLIGVCRVTAHRIRNNLELFDPTVDENYSKYNRP